MTTATTLNTDRLRAAIESRDADGVLAWYAPDAELTVVDGDHGPSRPQTYRGTDALGEYYRDLCGRNIDHEVRDIVSTPTGLGFAQHCRYPDGTRVLCVTVAEISDGRITRQTAVQAWDG
jgi:ketosteroid isomerase-like protein